jgi:hypothetical protein
MVAEGCACGCGHWRGRVMYAACRTFAGPARHHAEAHGGRDWLQDHDSWSRRVKGVAVVSSARGHCAAS